MVLEGLERISGLISRYAIFEDLYLKPQLKSYSGLERALTNLYVRVLKFLAKARIFYAKSSASKLVHFTHSVSIIDDSAQTEW